MALANIDRFVTLAHNMKVTSLDLLATAAVRDASDGPEFMREMERRPGLKAHIVSGRDEARFSGFGVMCGMPDASGVMGDLGGGSLELVALGNGGIGASSTLPVGPLRLMSSGNADPQADRDRRHRGRAWLREESGKTFYAVGGAWRSFAACTWSRRAIRCTSSITTTSVRRGARRGAADRSAKAPSRWRRCRVCRAGASTRCRSPAWRSTVCWRH